MRCWTVACRAVSLRGRCLLVVAACAVTGLLSGCRASTVRLAFVPVPGAVYRYRIHVDSDTTTRLTGKRESHEHASADLETVDTVVAVDSSGSEVRVDVREGDHATGTYLVRLDRQAGLISLEAADGRRLNAQAGLELAQLLPAAAGPPPQRSLHAGDRWAVDQALDLPRLAPARLRGSGRLESFGVLDGRGVAVTTSTDTVSLFPAEAPAGTVSGTAGVDLRGQETTTATITRSVHDGAVERSSATTTGTFDILLPGNGAFLVTGQVTVFVRSSMRRLG